MKKGLFITVIFIFCCLIRINAQTDKGATLIGGSFHFSNNQVNTTDHIKSGNAQLKIGHAFAPNIMWGVQGGYLFGDKTYISSSGNSGFSAGIFNRLYRPLSNAFQLFGESELGYVRSSNRITQDNNIQYSQDAVGLGFTPGLSYSVLDWARIELMLPNIFSVTYTQNRTTDNTRERIFAATTSLSSSSALNTLGLGFSVVF